MSTSQLKLLNIENFCKDLPVVSDPNIFTSMHSDQYSDKGLFSPMFFDNIGSKKFKSQYACINLGYKVFNPTVYSIVKKLDQKIDKIITNNMSFNLVDGSVVIDNKNGEYHGIISIMNLFDKIKFRGDTNDRARLINILEKNKESLFTSKMVVIPPAFRPIYINSQTHEKMLDEMNEIYIKALKTVNSIPNLVNFDNLTKSVFVSKLQIMYNVMYEYVKNKLGKKTGYYRSTLLGKRVDHSARSVISGDPDLDPFHVKVPVRMAVKLFEPFILNALTSMENEFKEEFNSVYPNDDYISAARKILSDINKMYIKKGTKLYEMIKKITLIAIKNKPICLKRDPSLQRDSWRSFYPSLTDDNVIHVSNSVCEGFNADFDGDQMAIYVPLTIEAQKDAIDKLMTTKSHKGVDQIAFYLKKDIFLGVYLLTKNYNEHTYFKGDITDEKQLLYNIKKLIRIKGKTMTVGQYLFNNKFREYANKYGFVLETMNKKSFPSLLQKLGIFYDHKIGIIIQEIQKLAYTVITIYPNSMTITDMNLTKNPKIVKLKQKLANEKDDFAKTDILNEMKATVLNLLKERNSALYDTIQSGASGNLGQINQIIGSKGIMSNIDNSGITTVNSSFSDGLTSVDFFKSTNGARSGVADRSMNTATAGYLTRQLVYALSFVKLSKDIVDCKTTRTLDIPNNKMLHDRLLGRYTIENGKPILITKDNISNFKIFHLRSPIFCRSKEICHTCYGRLMDSLTTRNIGVLAGQSLGERGTQLTMKTFHTGGSVSVSIFDIMSAFLRNQTILSKEEFTNLFEQKEKAFICKDNTIEFTINISYIDKNDIQIKDNDDIIIPVIDMTFTYKNQQVNLLADTQVSIPSDVIQSKNSNVIIIKADKKNHLFDVGTIDNNFAAGIAQLSSFLNKKEDVTNLLSLYNHIFDIYRSISSLDSVHMEILLAQLLRYKKELRIPARLAKNEWLPYKTSLKSVPYLDNWKMGMMFENIQKSIFNGLIASDVIETTGLEQSNSPILELVSK